jgi:release factor glutamine methyltransferase
MSHYSVADQVLTLEISEKVFKPTTTTHLLAEQIGDCLGKTVLDLGCGAGPIAISTALKGAEKVYAVDIMTEACELTSKNAKLNGVSDRIVVRQGSLFEPVVDLEFDIIIDDVSGIAEDVARVSSWYPEPIPSGGADGTIATTEMLDKAPEHLKEGGYLLFPVLSLACSPKILQTAQNVFKDNLQKLHSALFPFNAELSRNIQSLEQLRQQGIIHFIHKKNQYWWNLAIYKAWI